MYNLTIKVPIYSITIHVKISTGIDLIINKFCEKKKYDHLKLAVDEEVHGLAISLENATDYYIFYAQESLTTNLICHEISHVVDFVLGEKGIENSGEARAYLTGYISEKIFDYVLRKGILINKYLPKKEVKPINIVEDEKPGGLL